MFWWIYDYPSGVIGVTFGVVFVGVTCGLTPVSWRDESLGSGSLALRHVILRFLAFFGSASGESLARPIVPAPADTTARPRPKFLLVSR